MNDTISVETVDNTKAKPAGGAVTFLLILVLLTLRLPGLGGISFFSKAPPDWLGPVFEITTYLFTAILIWWERERLADYHINKLALGIIILFKPFETLFLALGGRGQSSLAFPQPFALVVWAIALGLFFAMRSSPLMTQKVPRSSLRWFGLGAAAGIGLAILLAYPMSLQIDKAELESIPQVFSLLVSFVFLFPYQLGYAAVTEEPLFRGFLWGYLRKKGIKDIWICLIQTGLFSLAHIYYLRDHPISFWIIVPLDAFVFGLLAWRSRSIATSMAAHGAVNTLGYSLGLLLAFYLQ